MGSPFNDFAMVEHNDVVRILHRGQSMRNDYHSPALSSTVQRILDCSFTLCIQCACRQHCTTSSQTESRRYTHKGCEQQEWFSHKAGVTMMVCCGGTPPGRRLLLVQHSGIPHTKTFGPYTEADMQTKQVQGGSYSYITYVCSHSQWLRAQALVTA